MWGSHQYVSFPNHPPPKRGGLGTRLGPHQYVCGNKTSMEYLVRVQVRHATAHILHLISKYHCQLLLWTHVMWPHPQFSVWCSSPKEFFSRAVPCPGSFWPCTLWEWHMIFVGSQWSHQETAPHRDTGVDWYMWEGRKRGGGQSKQMEDRRQTGSRQLNGKQTFGDILACSCTRPTNRDRQTDWLTSQWQTDRQTDIAVADRQTDWHRSGRPDGLHLVEKDPKHILCPLFHASHSLHRHRHTAVTAWVDIKKLGC